MTEIKGYIHPTRRPGELGVHSIDHFQFVVPDLTVAENFYSEFGLGVSERGNRLVLTTKGSPHEWGFVGEGPRKKHQHISFGAFEDDIDRFAKRLQDMRVPRLDPPPGDEFERPLVPRSRRQPGRDQGRAEDSRRTRKATSALVGRPAASAARRSAARCTAPIRAALRIF